MSYTPRNTGGASTGVLSSFKIEGTLYRLFPEKARGKYRITEFIVKQSDGNELKCSSFKPINPQLLGKVVGFEATLNEKYGSYTLTKDSEVATSPSQTGTTQAQSAPSGRATEAGVTVSKGDEVVVEQGSRRRGRPKRNETPASSIAVSSAPTGSVQSDLESVRNDAEAILKRDLAFVTSLGVMNPDSAGPFIQALQAIRATLFIEANKRDRVDAMNTRYNR